uniref:glucan endo-1,3-beta-D-glucosidase n=1 Tax=Brassica oleracea TaxID=3712 RepID=A0A3P6CL11_BRAOL|nr:unnamed protein product [Brassica oleracea]
MDSSNAPYLFPRSDSTVLPDPSRFFSHDLLSSPLPTNSFFQNFTLKNGDQAENFHPYLIKTSPSSLSISYPSLTHNMIEPWLDGSFGPNGFLYDPTWGGLITKLGSKDSGGDFGFGIYNDHHYHLGYFLYAIAVLVKIDNLWGKKYRPQVYALAADYMTLGKKGEGSSSVYTRLRCFDFFKLHSWAGGLTEFTDGRNQESTSEAVNGYYSAALLGLAYGDIELAAVASTVLAFEIHAAKMWWQVKEEDTLYPSDFTAENRVVGVLWSTKRDSGLWFAPKEWKECRLGIQLLPILPLVDWTLPALDREGGVGEGWKGFLYALESMYDKDGAMEKVKGLKGHDDGNSLSNLLWWIHSRNSGDE